MAIRTTYKQQANKDDDVWWLKDSPKKFENVKVRFQYGPAGKNHLKTGLKARAKQVAEIIRRHPSRKVLVLHHMEDLGSGVNDMEAAVRDELGRVSGLELDTTEYDVEFLHWNRHTADNSYSDRDLIITASILRKPPAAIEAIGRAAANRPAEELYSDSELRSIRQGEMLQDLLQGLSRGKMRRLIGDQAQGTLVYLMAEKNSGLLGEAGEQGPYRAGAGEWPSRRLGKAGSHLWR